MLGEIMSAAIQFPMEGLTETALDISKRRKDILLRTKRAIRKGDLDEADRLITELVPDDEKNNRIDSRVHRITSRKR